VDQPPERDHRIRELERRFRSAGLPLLAEDYSATEDVFMRPQHEYTQQLLAAIPRPGAGLS